ncbi:NUDIX domain-containing protein [Streptomyces showdoensis]|uniref:DNA hydrolase n=1 Tax=Streptomyces showdoensis TaxID=68268 RepID=A0A2P2GU42_STREW|nr:NUDIX hydrolase [Streptomyces showdoensis]KKZ75024.1 DNA hydrolase [Streptomyces showdoensis]
MTESYESVRLTADVVTVTEDGRVLLVERGRDPFKGLWALPGGHVDAGESSQEAAARELGEETGVLVDPAALFQVGAWDEPGRDPRGRYVTVVYLAVVPADTEVVAGDDAAKAVWWPYDSLPPLAFDHGAILDAVRDSMPS